MDPVRLFQRARTILCVCPHCGNIVRLSDLSLQYRGAAPHTWLDEYVRRDRLLKTREASFNEQEYSIRDAAHRRGQKRAQSAIRELVKDALPGCRYDPEDFKAILHPIDYVIFCGMHGQTRVSKIVLLSKEAEDPSLVKIRRSIGRAVDRGDFGWQLVRLGDDGRLHSE